MKKISDSALKKASLACTFATVVTGAPTLYLSDAAHPHGLFNDNHAIYDEITDNNTSYSELKEQVANEKTDLLKAVIADNKKAEKAQSWSIAFGLSASALLVTAYTRSIRRRDQALKEKAQEMLKNKNKPPRP